MSGPEHAATLRGVALFDGFTDGELDLLARVMVAESHKAGHVFLRQGDRVAGGRLGMYLITRGNVVVSVARGGGAAVSHTMGQGEVFGLIALIRGEGKRAATVTAGSPVEVLHLGWGAYQTLFAQEHHLAYKFQVMVARQLASDLRRLDHALRQAVVHDELDALHQALSLRPRR